MNEETVTGPEQLGERLLVPGVRYRVAETFCDSQGKYHVVGTEWKFEGYGSLVKKSWFGKKIFIGHFIVVFDAEERTQKRIPFEFDRHEKLLKNFSRYVASVFPSSNLIISKLSPEGLDTLKNVNPIPEGGEALIQEIRERACHLGVADGRCGWIGNRYEKPYEQMLALEEECEEIAAVLSGE